MRVDCERTDPLRGVPASGEGWLVDWGEVVKATVCVKGPKVRRVRRSGEWAVPVGKDDRERARAILVDRLRSGAMRFDEYERRMLKVERAASVPALYDATFGRARLPFGGTRWRRRRARLSVIGLVIAVAVGALGFMWMGFFEVAAVVVLGVAGMNVAVWVQARRYPLRLDQSVGGSPR